MGGGRIQSIDNIEKSTDSSYMSSCQHYPFYGAQEEWTQGSSCSVE